MDIDRERAASVGVPAAMLGTMLRSFLGGDAIIQYREGGDTFDVKVKLPPEVLADPDQVGALTVRTPMGQLVELRSYFQKFEFPYGFVVQEDGVKVYKTVQKPSRNVLGYIEGEKKDEAPKKD